MKSLFVIMPACAVLEIGCVVTPPLSEATGTSQSNIMIRDVVQRVKCELSDAFDQKTEQPEFLWLASWTAHIDLTLTINDNAGISPSGSFTHFEPNAVNQAAGPSAFPPTAARSVVNQMFTVSVGATLSGQAVRTETVSFTIALDELKMWRKRLDKIERDPHFPPENRLCNFGMSTGITGNLGLKEWVDSAFFPAQIQQLQAGIHSAASGKTPSAATPQPGNVGPKAASELTIGEALTQIKTWQDTLGDLQKDTKSDSDSITAGKTSIPKARASIEQKIRPYKYVLAPYLESRFLQILYLINQYSKDENACLHIQALLPEAQSLAAKLDRILKMSNLPPNTFVSQLNNAKKFVDDYNDLGDQVNTLEIDKAGNPAGIKDGQYATAVAQCAKIVKEATRLPDDLPKQLDPPIDSILHSLTFVINYGANVTPSWSLLQWKGPGQNPNFASAAGVRTHGLIISMGPRTGEPAIGPDALRLIQLQAIRSLNQQ